MCLCVSMCMLPAEAKESIRFHKTGLASDCEPPNMGLELRTSARVAQSA